VGRSRAGTGRARAARAVERRFAGPHLPPEFQWLRSPDPSRLFTLTGEALRLHGRESLGSWFEQSLVARRQEHLAFRAETELRFDPDTHQHAAGLAAYYNRHKLHVLAVTHDAALGRVLTILSCPGDWPETRLAFPLPEPVPLPEGPVALAAKVDHAALRFFWRAPGGWTPVGPELDASLLSDEAGRGEGASFTVAMVGMAAFDVSGRGRPSDFTRFAYLPRPEAS
jgi:xylan 1,4-beta-xylosidase